MTEQLLKLAERAEAATAEQQGEIFEEAFALIFPEPPRSWKPMPIQQAIKDPDHIPAIRAHSHWRRNIRGRFFALLDLNAIVDAALIFMPEGWDWTASSDGIATMNGPCAGGWTQYAHGKGATVPLRLLAGFCRAHAAKGDK